MRYKKFARSCGVFVSELALGTGSLGNRSGKGSEKGEARKILQRYAEAGGNLIDTSDAYQFGEAEELVGDFISSRRHEYFVVSKYSRGSTPAPALAAWGNSRKAMVTAVEASLRRLQTDYIDLYMPHFDDGQTSLDEIVEGMSHLVQSGKVLYPGFSNAPAWRISAAATLAEERVRPPIAGIEIEYNLVQRDAERDLLPMAAEMGLGVLVYSPLARGSLSDRRPPTTPRPSGEKLESILETVAKDLSATTPAVAVAWLLAKNLFPILGASQAAHLNSPLGAVEITLAPEQIRALDEAAPLADFYPHKLLAAQTALRPKIAHPGVD